MKRPRASRVDEDEALRRGAGPPDEQRSYAPGARRFGALRLPPGSRPHPVAILVHGGCWSGAAGPGYMECLAEELTDAGWATWNLAFRRLGDPGGGWPGTFRDVAAGADFLRALARERPLDLRRVVSVGHSSGGHLALWLAARRRIDPASELHESRPLVLRGAVSLAGIADLEAFHALPQRACDGRVAELLGGEPSAVPGRLAAASPAVLLPLGVPQLLVVGDDDPDVPAHHVEAYSQRARAAGDDVRLVRLEACGHFEPVAPWWPRWPEVVGPLGSFLERV